MPYVRRRGNQLAIVHGDRHPETGTVEQRILFTLYSKAEVKEAMDSKNGKAAGHFKELMEERYPDISFNWKKIRTDLSKNMDFLPDLYEYRKTRLRSFFRKDLSALVKQLVLADPQESFSSAEVIQEHKVELEFLKDLIDWRLKTCWQEKNEFNSGQPFYWDVVLHSNGVPPETEESAADFYEKGDYKRAKAIFKLLTECFDRYAEGHNYLGLIAMKEKNLEEAVGHFRKAKVLGRKLFPKRIARDRYWSDHSTRPYIRAMRNLASALARAGKTQEAFLVCSELEVECCDDLGSSWELSAIFLNTGQWEAAARKAKYLQHLYPVQSFIEAFALFELEKLDEATASFIHGMLNRPKTGCFLLGQRPKERQRTPFDVDDHNGGIEMLEEIAPFLKSQTFKSKRFFKDLLNHPRVVALASEMNEVIQQWQDRNKDPEDRTAYRRMHGMWKPEFARKVAKSIASEAPH